MMFKAIFFLCLMMPGISVNAQPGLSVDSMVKAIDNRPLKKYVFRKYNWEYTFFRATGKAVKIIRTKKQRDQTVTQTFYTHQNQLIYATESIINFYKNETDGDNNFWKAFFYLRDNKLIDLQTLGHGKSEDENWQPEREVLNNFAQAKDWVRRAASSIGHE